MRGMAGTIARTSLRLAACVLLCAAGPLAARAHELRLRHPAPELVASYRAYFGPGSGDYRQSVDLGPASGPQGGVLTLTFPSSLLGSSVLYLALTAVGWSGLESELSNEITLSATGPDQDRDGIFDANDVCLRQPNGPRLGTCVGGVGREGATCTASGDCGSGGWCSLGQEDTDGDGVGDACDLCPLVRDPQQADRDGDGLGDACDPRDDRVPPPPNPPPPPPPPPNPPPPPGPRPSTPPRSPGRSEPRPPVTRPPSGGPSEGPNRPVETRDPRDREQTERPTTPRDPIRR